MEQKCVFKKIRKRLFTLFIPYILCNTIFIAYQLLPRLGGMILKGKSPQGIVDWYNDHNGILMYYNASDFIERINWFGGNGMFSFPILIPMLYIRDLLVLSILSPVLYFFLCKQRKWMRHSFIVLI